MSSWSLGEKTEFLGDFFLALPLQGGLGVGVVAHPQGALAYSVLFLVGFESSLAISLSRERSKMGSRLWT